MLKVLAEENRLADYIEDLENISAPCLRGRTNVPVKDLSCSKVGGLPHANEDFIWPQYLGNPLEFVAQINLEEIDWHNLPSCGALLFFYANGYWADKKEQKDFIRIIPVKENKNIREIEPPSIHKKRFLGLLKPIIIPQIFDEYSISFSGSVSLPDLDNVERIPSLTKFDEDDDLMDSYYNLKSGLSGEGVLQIGGYPNLVQYDGIADRAASIMGKGSAGDWALLLEVDSKLGFMWGDAGRLYFFINKADLAVENFSEVWMELQCH